MHEILLVAAAIFLLSCESNPTKAKSKSIRTNIETDLKIIEKVAGCDAAFVKRTLFNQQLFGV